MPYKSILLVEDEDPKSRHIERFIHSLGDDIQVTTAKSVNSALDALDRETPVLLLLDMSLPTFDVGEREPGGRPQGFGGIEILRHMTLADVDVPTIVITGYEAFPRASGGQIGLAEIREQLTSEFPHLFRGILHYNSTYDEWKVELKKVLLEMGIGSDRA